MKKQGYNQESGNVLFLILIAVALFAALSYAVTQSTRSGGGSTDREQSILGSASLTQYPTALRTSIVRMVLSGTSATQLWFNTPANFGALSTQRLVFHPDGGGASFQDAPIDVMATNALGTWSHNMQFEVPNIGKTGAGGNELIAFLPGVNESTCSRINQQMGIASSGIGGCTYQNGIPTVAATDTNITVNTTNTTGTPPGTAAEVLQCGTTASTSAFAGRATGCFYDSSLVVGGGAAGNYVFYSVILER